jgi:hypothetical protein
LRAVPASVTTGDRMHLRWQNISASLQADARYPYTILSNAWHGAFFWIDELAYDVCRKLYDEFDIADEEGIKEAILEALPPVVLKLSGRTSP